LKFKIKDDINEIKYQSSINSKSKLNFKKANFEFSAYIIMDDVWIHFPHDLIFGPFLCVWGGRGQQAMDAWLWYFLR